MDQDHSDRRGDRDDGDASEQEDRRADGDAPAASGAAAAGAGAATSAPAASASAALAGEPADDGPDVVAATVEHVVRVRGLPWSTTRADIERFFEQGQVGGVVAGGVAMPFQGLADGFVALESPDAKARALKMTKKPLGPRMIDIEDSSPEAFYRARDVDAPPDAHRRCVLRLVGLAPEVLGSRSALRDLFTSAGIALAPEQTLAAAAAAAGLGPEEAAALPPHAVMAGVGARQQLVHNVFFSIKVEASRSKSLDGAAVGSAPEHPGRFSGDAFVVAASAFEAERAVTELANRELAGRALKLSATHRGELASSLCVAYNRGLGRDADYFGCLRLSKLMAEVTDLHILAVVAGAAQPATAAAHAAAVAAAAAASGAAEGGDGDESAMRAESAAVDVAAQAVAVRAAVRREVVAIREAAAAVGAVHVFMGRRSEARFTGEAVVVFASEEQARAARLRLETATLLGRPLDSAPRLCAKAEGYVLVGGSFCVREDGECRSCLHLVDMPFKAAPEHVVEQLRSAPEALVPGQAQVALKDVFIHQRFDGRPAGVCFVLFDSEEAAEACLAAHPKIEFAERPGSVVTASIVARRLLWDTLSRSPSEHARESRGHGGGGVGGDGSPPAAVSRDNLDVCLRLKGVQFNVKEEDVVAFFSTPAAGAAAAPAVEEGPDAPATAPSASSTPVPSKVHMLVRDGRVLECFAEFASLAEAQAAMCRNKASLSLGGTSGGGSRYIELYPAHRREVRDALAGRAVKGLLGGAQVGVLASSGEARGRDGDGRRGRDGGRGGDGRGRGGPGPSYGDDRHGGGGGGGGGAYGGGRSYGQGGYGGGGGGGGGGAPYYYGGGSGGGYGGYGAAAPAPAYRDDRRYDDRGPYGGSGGGGYAAAPAPAPYRDDRPRYDDRGSGYAAPAPTRERERSRERYDDRRVPAPASDYYGGASSGYAQQAQQPQQAQWQPQASGYGQQAQTYPQASSTSAAPYAQPAAHQPQAQPQQHYYPSQQPAHQYQPQPQQQAWAQPQAYAQPQVQAQPAYGAPSYGAYGSGGVGGSAYGMRR